MADGVAFIPLFIDNDYRSGDVTFEFRNPYTGQVAGIAASATSQDCKDAIESAGRAFVKWEHSPLEQRRNIFLKAADLLESPEFKDVIISAMRAETAMIEEMTVHNIEDAAMFMRKVAGMTNQLKGETFSSTVSGGHVVAQRRAKGVILSIAPWNAPVYLTVRAVGVAILCGNTVVLKCSEYSPWSQFVVARIFHGAGLPSGVLNFISMDSKDAPALTAEMIAHPLVRAINFTGSDRVGRIIAAEAAKYLKPCIFELGGKAAAVVLDDADVAQAARAVVSSGMYHSGQLCMSTERLIVQRAVSEQLIKEVTQLVKGLKAGDPRTDSTAQLSALFTENAAKSVISMMSEAVAEGAQVILGDLQRQGAIVQPHLLTGVTPGMRLWKRESFGPVITIAVVDTVDEAVDLANSTEYSLAASLWTKDINKALDVSGRIRSGMTNVNGPTFHIEPLRENAGLGGASGYGKFDVDHFTDIRMIVIHPSGPQSYPVIG